MNKRGRQAHYLLKCNSGVATGREISILEAWYCSKQTDGERIGMIQHHISNLSHPKTIYHRSCKHSISHS